MINHPLKNANKKELSLKLILFSFHTPYSCLPNKLEIKLGWVLLRTTTSNKKTK
jgi:hypothetical protein